MQDLSYLKVGSHTDFYQESGWTRMKIKACNCSLEYHDDKNESFWYLQENFKEQNNVRKLHNMFSWKPSNLHFLAIQQHAIDLLNGTAGSFLCLKVHKAIAFGRAVFISDNLEETNQSKMKKKSKIKNYPSLNPNYRANPLDQTPKLPFNSNHEITCKSYQKICIIELIHWALFREFLILFFIKINIICIQSCTVASLYHELCTSTLYTNMAIG